MSFSKKPEIPKAPKVETVAPTTMAGKFKCLEALSKQLDIKNETTNSLQRLGSKVGLKIPSIQTYLPSLDNDVLECGGVPRGVVVEIFGPESSGKTTISLHIIACEQKQGGLAAFVDAEHALDVNYASTLGVDIDNLVINQPNSGEQALDTVDQLIKSKCVSLIVVDSVAAIVPEAELSGEIGDAHVGLQARLMSQACRMLVGECRRNGVTVIFINQIREKIGVMFGSPETTTGGRALKFYSSVRIDVRRRKEIKDGTALIGHTLELKCVKNKVGRPFQSTELDLFYPIVTDYPGLDTVGDTIAYASKRGLFEMSGSWYNMDLGRLDDKKKNLGVERLANGLANLKMVLRNDAKSMEVIRKKIDALLKKDAEGSTLAAKETL